MHVGRGDHRAVREARLAVHPDVQLHPKVPLLALAGLVHVRVALAAGGAGADLQALGLQHLADLGEQGRTQIVCLQQAAKLQQRGRVGHALTAEVDAHEAAQRGTVEQCVFAGPIGEVEPVLHEVHPQHALQPDGRAAVAGLRLVRLDHAAKRVRRHHALHRGQEHVAPRRLAVLFVRRVLVGGHGEGLLLHGSSDAGRVPGST
jgi:hypothetical protein